MHPIARRRQRVVICTIHHPQNTSTQCGVVQDVTGILFERFVFLLVLYENAARLHKAGERAYPVH